MDWKLFATAFGAIFVAEMADKTQLVTLLFAADREVSKLTVFLASASALVLASAIGVAAGALVSKWFSETTMSLVAGTAFVVIGALTLLHGLQAAR